MHPRVWIREVSEFGCIADMCSSMSKGMMRWYLLACREIYQLFQLEESLDLEPSLKTIVFLCDAFFLSIKWKNWYYFYDSKEKHTFWGPFFLTLSHYDFIILFHSLFKYALPHHRADKVTKQEKCDSRQNCFILQCTWAL